MDSFAGKIAVITGGGTGMGRALARALVAEGCDVAMCDLSREAMAQSVALCEADAPQGIRVTSYLCNVAIPEEMTDFANHVRDAFATDHINLLFNNAGIAGGGSFVNEAPEDWERTFNVCWGGVYNGARAFMPLLRASAEGHIVNTSSINGLWASAGPQAAHTSYSAAKFAVRGFTEALITDLRLHAPHVKASVVMPGHIGTSILLNSAEQGTATRDAVLHMLGANDGKLDDNQRNSMLEAAGTAFRDQAPTTADEAAQVILDGVRSERWRILIGRDAEILDRLVRADPENAYEPGFAERWRAERDA